MEKIGVSYTINNKQKMNIKSLRNEKIHMLIHLVLYIGLVVSYLNPNINSSLVSIIIAMYFLFSSPVEHFYFLIGFAPFEHIAKVGDISFYFVFLLISSIKLILLNIKEGYKIIGVIALIMLVSLEILGDLQRSSIGTIIINLCTIIYFAVFVMKIDSNRFNADRILKNFYFSYFTVIIYVITGYGSLGTFLNMATTENLIVRFGREEGITVGGAMGIPMYSALLISMSIGYYHNIKNRRLLQKTILLLGSVSAFAVGLLTVSRSFLLCMIAGSVVLIFSLTDKKRKQAIKLFIAITSLGIVIYLKYADTINILLNKFIYRAKSDVGLGSRGDIWLSCLDYLLEHPLGLLYGYGINSYNKIGENLNLLFSAKAHNLYLDVIMSLGTLGFMCLCILVYIYIKRISEKGIKVRIISTMPLVVLISFGLTALDLSNLKTWIYILMTILFAYKASRDSEVKG